MEGGKGVVLTKKGVEHDVTSENMVRKRTLLLACNPVHAKVPVLLVTRNPVCGSLVILEYMDAPFVTSGEKLLGADPGARANARFWAAYVDAKVGTPPYIWTLDRFRARSYSVITPVRVCSRRCRPAPGRYGSRRRVPRP
jgi:hypothetical protein